MAKHALIPVDNRPGWLIAVCLILRCLAIVVAAVIILALLWLISIPTSA